MQLFIFMACLLTAFVSHAPSYAQTGDPYISAAYLYEVCKRDSDGKEVVENGSATCQSYVAGVIDYHNMLQSLGTSPNVDVCVPKQAKLKDLQEIVWHYLDRNSHHDAFVAAPAVTLALFQVFPCKSSKTKK